MRSWDELWRESESRIVGAKTTSGWAKAVAKALEPAGDIHLTLRFAERVLGTSRRAVDSLWRPELAARHVSIAPAGRGQAGRTEDGIGYVMIPAWQVPADVGEIERALAGLRDVAALVVDVRPNSGGDELLAHRIAAWFVEGEPVYAKHCFRVKPGQDGFGPVQERRVRGNAEPEKRIRMPIAVLTSRYVISSNESFVLMMRQAPDCTVVGQPTFGSSGNPKPHELPNGVTIVVPSWVDLRPDGTGFEGEGLAPDVAVEVDPKALVTRDPILEKALEVLRAKRKG